MFEFLALGDALRQRALAGIQGGGERDLVAACLRCLGLDLLRLAAGADLVGFLGEVSGTLAGQRCGAA